MTARQRLIVIALAAVAGLGLGLIGYSVFGPGGGVREARIGQALIGGPFTLVDGDGRTRTDAEFRGRLMLIEFGYTHCPDICPLGLAVMAEALALLGPTADQVQPIFITVDPERDTPALVKDYVAHFSERFVGLSGTPEQVAEAARNYRVYYKARRDAAAGPDYLVDHSGFLYLMGRDGQFLTHFTHETPPEKMAEAIRRHL